MTAISVLNFVFGGWGVLGALYVIIITNSMMSNPLMSFAQGASQMAALQLLQGILRLGVGAVAIVAGIGLILVAPWGRGWTLAYAILGIVNIVMSTIIALVQTNGKIGTGAAAIGAVIVCVIVGVIGCIYPVVLLSFLRSAKWKEAFLANTPMASALEPTATAPPVSPRK
jgi:cytochrome bd-type quinol oxidase subunit 2